MSNFGKYFYRSTRFPKEIARRKGNFLKEGKNEGILGQQGENSDRKKAAAQAAKIKRILQNAGGTNRGIRHLRPGASACSRPSHPWRTSS